MKKLAIIAFVASLSFSAIGQSYGKAGYTVPALGSWQFKSPGITGYPATSGTNRNITIFNFNTGINNQAGLAIQGGPSNSAALLDLFPNGLGYSGNFLNAQISVNNLSPSTTDFEKAALYASSSAFYLTTLKGGSGVSRPLYIGVGSYTGQMAFNTNSTITITGITPAGNNNADSGLVKASSGVVRAIGPLYTRAQVDSAILAHTGGGSDFKTTNFSTTNATAKNVDTVLALAGNYETITIEVDLASVNQSSTAGNYFAKKRATFRNDGSSITQLGSTLDIQSDNNFGSLTSCTFSFAISGNNIITQFTGQASTNISSVSKKLVTRINYAP